MPSWIPVTPYKGLFILVLVFVLLEYFFGTFSETKAAFSLNSTKTDSRKRIPVYGPLYKALLLKNDLIIHGNTSNSAADTLVSFNYVVTEPTFLQNINSTRTTVPELVSTVNSENVTIKNNGSVTYCTDDVSPNLKGRVAVIRSPIPTASELEKKFSWLMPGGHWQPKNCTVPKKVAIIVPFRCRGKHLILFLQHMHPFLQRQQLDYTLFVIEQDGDGSFNRGMLMNIGFQEALNESNFDCFIFHDVDLLPEDDRNLYTCPEQPRHMSVAIDVFKYRLPYPAIFGGVSAISKSHFQLLNGFSNSFWGWGGEDDDMSNRLRYHHLHISRYPLSIARYTMLTHTKDKPNPNRFDILRKGQKKFDKDGLNTLNYKVVLKKHKLLYTWILVLFEQPG